MNDSRELFASQIEELMKKIGKHAMGSDDAVSEWEKITTSKGDAFVNLSTFDKMNGKETNINKETPKYAIESEDKKCK